MAQALSGLPLGPIDFFPQIQTQLIRLPRSHFLRASRQNFLARSGVQYVLKAYMEATNKVLTPSTTTPKWMRWWDKDGAPNMIDINSMKEFTDAIAEAGDKLVVADFYASWCASCRALYPKLCKIARENPEVIFLKINFEENSAVCKALNVSVLPLFQFYRGGSGERLTSFSCSLSTIKKLKDAIAKYGSSSGALVASDSVAVESDIHRTPVLSDLDSLDQVVNCR